MLIPLLSILDQINKLNVTNGSTHMYLDIYSTLINKYIVNEYTWNIKGNYSHKSAITCVENVKFFCSLEMTFDIEFDDIILGQVMFVGQYNTGQT